MVDIDPLTGAPIIPLTDSPKEELHSLDLSESQPSTEGTSGTDSFIAKETEPETEVVKVPPDTTVPEYIPLTRAGFLDKVKDILKYSGGDTMQQQQTLAKIAEILPE